MESKAKDEVDLERPSRTFKANVIEVLICLGIYIGFESTRIIAARHSALSSEPSNFSDSFDRSLNVQFDLSGNSISIAIPRNGNYKAFREGEQGPEAT